MRRLGDDDGAVAVIVALMAVMLFGFGAIAIDVGSLYAERRQLQSGSDAGAFAVAKICATTSCPDTTAANATAQNYGGLNDLGDGLAAGEICGTGLDSWPDCSTPPELPPGVKYVKVQDSTLVEDPGGSAPATRLPTILAQVLPGDQVGTQVGASSAVAWGYGTRTANPVLPFIMSVCEWQKFLPEGGGMGYADRPADLVVLATKPTVVTTDPGSSFPWDYERQVFTHAGGTSCNFNPSGQTGVDDQVSGDFGWLYDGKGADKGDCTPTVTAESDGTETVPGKNGYEVCVMDWLDAHLGQVVDVPIYAVQPETTNPTIYEIAGWAPLYLTGYNLGGKPQTINRTSDPDPLTPACLTPKATKELTEADSCITGFLVKMPVSEGPIVGPSFGLTTTTTTLVQ